MKHKKDNILAYILLSPSIIIMLGFVLYPILTTFIYSLHKLNLKRPKEVKFIFLDNYIQLLGSKSFHTALLNSLYVLLLMLIITAICSFALAMFLSGKSLVSKFLIAVLIVPWALPAVVNGILWRFIFYPGNGLANMLLLKLGLILSPIQWINNKYLALGIIAFISAWRHIPFCSLVFMAAIQQIPKSVLEASRLEGAGLMSRIRYIILPMLKPSCIIVLASTFIQAINIFDEIVALSAYRELTKTLLIENYLINFSFMDFGKGSALVYLIMLCSSWVALFRFNTKDKKEL